MRFVYTPELVQYMEKTGKHNIAVEIASSSSSDFEVSEFHIHFVRDKDVPFFREKKHFAVRNTEYGALLFPPYKLEYDDTLTFDIRHFGPIHWVTQTGIRF